MKEYIRDAVERLKNAYNYSQHLGLGKLYVAFSGGKDSVCVWGLCELAAKELNIPLLDFAEFHYNVTNVDPPELVRFIRNTYKPKGCQIDHPKETMWQLIVKMGMPPTRRVRYCCANLKERGGEGRFCVTGVRRAESVKRSKRKGFEMIGKKQSEKILFGDNDIDRRELEHCQLKRKWMCNPIIDWTDKEVWSFIREYNIPYCELYDKDYTRLGCIGCPMGSQRQRLEQFRQYPGFKAQYIRSFDKMLKAKKKECQWKNGQEVFNWWIAKRQEQAETLDFSEEKKNYSSNNNK